MGTSAKIIVEGMESVAVYKHYDGYPATTFEWLEWFNKDFTEKRGDDPSYKLAQLLRSSVRSADRYGLDDSEYTGWGVMPAEHLTCNYHYKLCKDGTVTWEQISQ